MIYPDSLSLWRVFLLFLFYENLAIYLSLISAVTTKAQNLALSRTPRTYDWHLDMSDTDPASAQWGFDMPWTTALDDYLVGIDDSSTMSNVLTLNDMLVRSPELPAMKAIVSPELESCRTHSQVDGDGALAAPIRQDSLSQPLTSGVLAQDVESESLDLLTSLELGTIPPQPQNNAISTPCIVPYALQDFGARPNIPDRFSLPEVGQTPIPDIRDYGTRPLYQLPLFSGAPPPVPPKDYDDTLPLPALLSFADTPPPVSPKHNSYPLPNGELRSVNFPSRHLIRPQYPHYPLIPHHPLMSLPDYEDMESLSLDPEERLVHIPTPQPADAEHLTPTQGEILSPSPNITTINSEDVDIDFSPPQSPSLDESRSDFSTPKFRPVKWHPPSEPVKGPITIKPATRQTLKLANAMATAKANAGTSGYAPRNLIRKDLMVTDEASGGSDSDYVLPRRGRRINTTASKRTQRLSTLADKSNGLGNGPVNGPVTIRLAKNNNGRPHRRLTASIATAEANAGLSGYVPHRVKVAQESSKQLRLPVRNPLNYNNIEQLWEHPPANPGS